MNDPLPSLNAMIPYLEPPSDGPEIWDATKLSSYTCEMRGHYAMERHLRTLEPSEALAFGKAFHKAVEVWTQASLDDVTPAITGGVCTRDPMKEAKDAFARVWEADLPKELRDKLEVEGNRRSVANGHRLFEAFTRKFPLEMFDKIVATETPFTLYLGRTPLGREISWSGILDRGVVWQEGLYIVDVKTWSPWGGCPNVERFFAQQRLRGQFLGYAWAGRELGWGNFNGIMCHAVEVSLEGKTIRAKKKLEDFIQLDVINLVEEHINEWRDDTLRKIDRIYAAREAQYWIRDRGDLCNAFGGCPYRDICEANPLLRESIIETNYRREEWNPMTRTD